MKKILITGSLGLVGSQAVSFFTEKGWDVTGIDNNMRSVMFGTPRMRDKYTTLDIDIRDEESVNNVVSKIGPFDAIIHAAAQPSHDWAKREPLTDFDINARATLILLEATRKYCPEAVFVHVSSDKVYGENMSVEACNKWPTKQYLTLTEKDTRYEVLQRTQSPFLGFTEDLGLDFGGRRSLFGCSKVAADVYVQEYGNYFGMKAVCFRPGCITGKNHQGAEYHGFLAYLAQCIKDGKTYKIFGYKGKQVRDQIHVHDLVTAFEHFIENPKVSAVYNMGGGPERSVSVLEAGELISKRLGVPFTYELHDERKGDRIWDVHDVSKFRADYPKWDYRYALSDIIKELCEV